MAGFGLVFLIEFLDDTVKTPEDVLKHTGFVVIGTIPVFSRKGRRA
jgi:capsular polysaccharide biosynthesis protein